jgi:hypothetical protein
MEDYEARVNITYSDYNGDLPDPVNFDATPEEVRSWLTEAIRTGSIPGIPADPEVNLENYVVRRIPKTEAIPVNRLVVHPKTPFG